MTRLTLTALTAVVAVLLSGCAGNGTPIADGQRCGAWLHGNGRDRYLAAHGMAEYDAGNTRRRDHMAVRVGAQMDRLCEDNPRLLIDEALRLAAGAAPPAAPRDPKTSPEPTDTRRTDGAKRP